MSANSIAASLGITAIYSSVAENVPAGLRGSQFVLTGYEWYLDNRVKPSNNVNGAVFECLILDALWRHQIVPVYFQAEVTHVPNALFDVFLYHPVRPVVISCKTSLRERWKQAAVEGLVLKQVYRQAESYLVTLSDEGFRRQKDIEDSGSDGLDECIVIKQGQTRFDDMLDRLKANHEASPYTVASPILPVNGRVIA